jgi:coenzyme F420-0:L-glutamate ligase/coenzyme F420-1:gamma-L-glutamate ligase
VNELRVIPVRGLPEIAAGDDVAALIAATVALEEGDVVVVAQKVVSKSEGRVVRLEDAEPSARARELAGDEDARKIEWILREAARVVRARPPLIVAETRQGFICASAGVDASNAPAEGTLVLLPVDPDASAHRLRARLRELAGADVAVIVSDSFGRPWRIGTTDVAIGAAGLRVLRDLRGTRDRRGYELRSTQIAVADELAGAAELVMGKAEGIPAAVIRGADVAGAGSARELVIPEERDLFR